MAADAPPPGSAPDQEAAHLEYEQFRAENDRLRAENAHLRAALHRLRDLGHGMSRTWYLREIDDGLNVPGAIGDNETPLDG